MDITPSKASEIRFGYTTFQSEDAKGVEKDEEISNAAAVESITHQRLVNSRKYLSQSRLTSTVRLNPTTDRLNVFDDPDFELKLSPYS